VLPCYWIYQHIGTFLKAHGSQNHKYQAWIDLYGGEEFEASVMQVLQMMDQVAAGLTTGQWEACKKHFLLTSKMEYMFWDGPYRGEVWPC
jgi:thiaminase (transcriptional activator TenA)